MDLQNIRLPIIAAPAGILAIKTNPAMMHSQEAQPSFGQAKFHLLHPKVNGPESLLGNRLDCHI